MFSGLRQNNVFYILEKGENPSLKVGRVVSVSNPTPRFGAAPYSPDTFVDVSVRVGDETMDFKQLPSALSITNNGNLVVSDSREAMLAEVDGMRRVSEDALKSTSYHENVVKACDGILATLNPDIAEKKETSAKIVRLEERMGGIEQTLSNVEELLGSLNKSLAKTK